MKVILNKEVKKIGNAGDTVEVSDGYARNYLFPRKLAKEATLGNLKILEMKKEQEVEKARKEVEQFKKHAAILNEATIKVTAKAGEKGRLFGSVTSKEIADLIKQQFNLKVDKRKIDLPDSIKALGSYRINIKLHPEVAATVMVEVKQQS